MLVFMICGMMNSNNYAEKHGKRNINSYLLIDLGREIKGNILFAMKGKSHYLNVLRKRRLFD